MHESQPLVGVSVIQPAQLQIYVRRAGRVKVLIPFEINVTPIREAAASIAASNSNGIPIRVNALPIPSQSTINSYPIGYLPSSNPYSLPPVSGRIQPSQPIQPMRPTVPAYPSRTSYRPFPALPPQNRPDFTQRNVDYRYPQPQPYPVVYNNNNSNNYNKNNSPVGK